MRHAEPVMGTVFSFDVRHGEQARPAVASAVALLHRIDAVFSTYRPDSAISRLDRGEITLRDCPPEVTEVLDLCARVESATDGYFSVVPSHHLDPSALVKGWAVDRACDLLRNAGCVRHCVNGGGDVRLGEPPEPGRPWRIGIAHPLRRGELLCVVEGTELAVATSGTAERGDHILDPHTGLPARGLAAITLLGADLTTVDAYATAAFAMGAGAHAWAERTGGIEALAVTDTGTTWRTSGFAHHLR
ncbi:FAD:protein FMN transferase [Acrocarpospora catenulata]|uniref:FAD:protein FMN transferase n=1 Tax=Acrocarpospora catenulata TaxID=2836182 RepID=UPI001BD91D01|nr:FAD:protein FMN transferase [Acrocarpospora catenulata]